jgi:hypothetical protein
MELSETMMARVAKSEAPAPYCDTSLEAIPATKADRVRLKWEGQTLPAK